MKKAYWILLLFYCMPAVAQTKKIEGVGKYKINNYYADDMTPQELKKVIGDYKIYFSQKESIAGVYFPNCNAIFYKDTLIAFISTLATLLPTDNGSHDEILKAMNAVYGLGKETAKVTQAKCLYTSTGNTAYEDQIQTTYKWTNKNIIGILYTSTYYNVDCELREKSDFSVYDNKKYQLYNKFLTIEKEREDKTERDNTAKKYKGL